MMKSASRNKLLHCFRPMVDMDEPDLAFNCLVFPKVHSDDDDENTSRSASVKKRTLSSVVKAVFFDTLLAKRSRGYSKSKELRTTMKKSASCSSLSDSASEPATPKYRKMNKEDDSIMARNIRYEKAECCNTGLYMLLISLAVTVLFGRLSAIVFTSIWLCVVFTGESARKSRRRGKRKVIMEI